MISIGRSLSFPESEARLPNSIDAGLSRFRFRDRHLSVRMDSTVTRSSPSSSSSSSVSSSASSLSLQAVVASKVGASAVTSTSLLSVRVINGLLAFFQALLFLLLAPFHPERYFRGGKERTVGKRDCVVVEREEEKGEEEEEAVVRRGMAIRRVGSDFDEDGMEENGRLSTRKYELLPTSRGDTLFTQSWCPVTVPPKGLVILLHGLNEHSSRYNRFAKQLNAKGFKVYAMDWIGHGGSGGLHGYVPSLDYAVNDMKAYLKEVLAQNPGFPCFCFGHSTGGAIVLKAALDPQIETLLDGVAVTSPAIRVQPSHPLVSILAPILSIVAPTCQFSNEDKKGLPVSRDPNALLTKYSDPLVFTGSIRVRTGYEILRIASYLQRNLSRMKLPFLVLHGTSDTVTDPNASKRFFKESSSTDKSIKLYDGYLHDLLFEPERDDISREIIDWLSSRLRKAES